MSLRQTAFVTTCKGRLNHLKQSLPRIVALEPAEIIVVDYDCPQGTAAWVQAHYPNVKVIKVSDAPIFNLAKARNLGAQETKSQSIFFCDADILFDQRILDWFNSVELDNSKFYLQRKKPKYWDTFGTCLVPRHSFEKVGGYDDVLEGWSGEDEDFYVRLNASDTKENFFENYKYEAIEHSDVERTTHYTIKETELQIKINLIYIEIKKIAMLNLKSQKIPREGRLEIMRQATLAANYSQIEQKSGEGKLSMTMAPIAIFEKFKLSTKIIIEFSCT